MPAAERWWIRACRFKSPSPGRQVHAEVLLRYSAIGAVGLHGFERLIDGFAKLGISFPDQHAGLTELLAIVQRNDTNRGVRLLLLEIQKGQLVIHRGIHAA